MSRPQLRLIAGVVVAGAGVILLGWAYLREYRDLQRLYALGFGWVLLLGGVAVLLIGSRRNRG